MLKYPCLINIICLFTLWDLGEMIPYDTQSLMPAGEVAYVLAWNYAVNYLVDVMPGESKLFLGSMKVILEIDAVMVELMECWPLIQKIGYLNLVRDRFTFKVLTRAMISPLTDGWQQILLFIIQSLIPKLLYYTRTLQFKLRAPKLRAFLGVFIL